MVPAYKKVGTGRNAELLTVPSKCASMEYVQERIATLHDFGEVTPAAPTDRATVVVPVMERDIETDAAERVLSTLGTIAPDRVVIALRAERDAVPAVATWLETFDLPHTLLWCTAPRIETRLDEVGLDGPAGKGRDVWLALGVASDADYVVVHDADAKSYDRSMVPRLLHPLVAGFEFSKGFYARVEHGRLYGRLVRLFVLPLVRALREVRDAPILAYLDAFRYPLAGEFAVTGELARRLRVHPGWGLELGTLGEAYDSAGFDGTAQVDLGIHRHDHRAVDGPDGLGDMATEVGQALFRLLADRGLEPDLETVRAQYVSTAERLVDQYAADATFNGFSFDRAAEREQVSTYADAIGGPGPDRRLPAWVDTQIDPGTIRELSEAALATTTER
jgi:glucosyl-3-phosphoglycerate synthase